MPFKVATDDPTLLALEVKTVGAPEAKKLVIALSVNAEQVTFGIVPEDAVQARIL